MPEIPCAGAVVLDAAGRILLIRRGQEPAMGRWSIPGGRVEPGEPHEAAAVREVAEETGIAVDVVRELGTVRREAPGGGTYVIRDFLAVPVPGAAGGTVPAAGDDAADARWCTRAELAALETSEGLWAALEEWGVLPS